MIGKALTKALVKLGHHVIILTRKKRNSADKNISYAQWDVHARTIDSSAVQQADYMVHLAGAGVADSRWTEARKKEIRESRTKSGALLASTLQNIQHNVKAVVSASAIGWYGADPAIPNPHPFTEDAPAEAGFLGQTCLQWERSMAPVAQLTRLVTYRIGVVLSNEGGAYKEFKKPMQFGAATIMGSGNQIISWIHVDDLVRLLIFAIENENLQGVYNAVTPHPVSNKTLMMQMAKNKSVAIPVHVPALALKVALGEMSIEVLKSATVSSQKIEAAGFTFQYPTIEKAVSNLK